MDTMMPYHESPEPAEALPTGLRPARSNATRIIHLLLLLVVLNQLAGSQFMERPEPGDDSLSLYLVHQYSGLAGFAVVGAFWVWTLVRRGETSFGRLVPWFSPARLRDVGGDFSAQARRLVRGRASDDDDGSVSSAVHGLGLLAVTAMAATGTVWFYAHGTPAAHLAMSAHKLVANLVWAYLFAHAGLAVLHHLLGSNIFSRMFVPASRQAAP